MQPPPGPVVDGVRTRTGKRSARCDAGARSGGLEELGIVSGGLQTSGILPRDALLLEQLVIRDFGVPPDAVVALKGDGSDRRVYRIHTGGSSFIGVAGDNIAENRAFLGFTRSFAAAGLAVPEIISIDAAERCYMLEDLGDTLLYDWQWHRRSGPAVPPDVLSMYRAVLKELVRFQIDAGDRIDFSLCYQYREFALEAMQFDVRYFKDMFVDQLYRGTYDGTAFERDAGRFIDRLAGVDRRHFLYRDFQSRNVMITAGVPRFIDYQSGRLGALQYDAASLLYDAGARIPEDVRRDLLAGYLDDVRLREPVDDDSFIELFDAFAIIRVMQALGAFGNLGFRKNRKHFRAYIPAALENLLLLARRSRIAASLPGMTDLFLALADDPNLRTMTGEP